jgi:hypothetical protein
MVRYSGEDRFSVPPAFVARTLAASIEAGRPLPDNTFRLRLLCLNFQAAS